MLRWFPILACFLLVISAAQAQSARQIGSHSLRSTVRDLAVSPDGRFAVVRAGASSDGITFYRLADGHRIGAFEATSGLANGVRDRFSFDSVAISLNGARTVVVGGVANDSVRVFDTSGATPIPMATFGMVLASHDLALSPQGRFAVVQAGDRSGLRTFYQLTADGRSASFFTPRSPEGVDSVAISPDGTRTVALAGAGREAVTVFDTSTASPVELRSHRLGNPPHDLAIAPDGHFAVIRTGTWKLAQEVSQGVVFLDLSDGTVLATFATASAPPTVRTDLRSSDSVAISADGSRTVVLGGATADSVMIFDSSGPDAPVLLASHDLSTLPHDLALAPDGRFAVVRAGASEDGISFYRLSDGASLAAFSATTAPPDELRGQSSGDSVEVSPDSERVVVLGGSSESGEVMIFDTSEDLPHRLIRDVSDGFLGIDVEITPDSGAALVHKGGGDSGIAFYNLRNGSLIQAFDTSGFPWRMISDAVAISPNGRRAVALSESHVVNVFALESAEVLPDGFGVEVASLSSAGALGDRGSHAPALSADGRLVAFESDARNLAERESRRDFDIFVRNRAADTTERISLGSDGQEGNRDSRTPSISANGRHVAFSSTATNLGFDDSNGVADIFVRDRLLGTTVRISNGFRGDPADGPSNNPALSADGRWIAFESQAGNLVDGDTNGTTDIFVHDRLTGNTERVSVAGDGSQANGASVSAALSGDGRRVAFLSGATNLVPGDTNDRRDAFVHDRWTGETRRISVSNAGVQADRHCHVPGISRDGRFALFGSAATKLDPEDTNGVQDLFVHRLEDGRLERVSLSTGSGEGNDACNRGVLSGDGRFVAFQTLASDLVPGDFNQVSDVLIRDRATAFTTRVSLSQQGEPGAGPSVAATLSADGETVAFVSEADNLVPGDFNGEGDVFVALNPLIVDGDGDGVGDVVEAAARGDGNGDGVADHRQAHVASLPNRVDGRAMTLVSAPDATLAVVSVPPNPSPQDAPPQTAFPVGHLAFEGRVPEDGAAMVVELIFPPGITATTYWNYGPTVENPNPHWYPFDFDGTTGAQISSDRLTLHLIDGGRGDGDLTADGRIVATGGPAVLTSACNASPTALCLADDRFRIETTWQTDGEDSGLGQATMLTDNTGYFWFFQPSNIEMLVKVLDACNANGHFWVFAGGLTNVGVEISVTDTLTGLQRTYTNPPNTAFQPLQDTAAFATCP